ncbi:MAG TPA: hypothetical protein VNI78_10865 [Vicinamibacterales bacterium]|nr:hypothetical protein [Vicinamibacterales bacterium]
MTRFKVVAGALTVAALAVVTSTTRAQETNTLERTFLTFSAPVELPGVTLPAGTYVFKLADTPSRNVVQVWDADEKNILGQWLFVQAERPEVTSENVIMFKETPAGTTPAIQYWYFPGERIGKEFVYPRDQAMRIAARTGGTVLSTEGEVGATSSVESVGAQGSVTPWQPERPGQPRQSAQAQVIEGQGLGEPAGAREPVEVDRSEQRPIGTAGPAESEVARADELPQTASPLGLTALAGLLSLAGALGLRARRTGRR